MNVPEEGIEPSRAIAPGILSPVRLPIPPPRHRVSMLLRHCHYLVTQEIFKGNYITTAAGKQAGSSLTFLVGFSSSQSHSTALFVVFADIRTLFPFTKKHICQLELLGLLYSPMIPPDK
jgi:hypothetical protein